MIIVYRGEKKEMFSGELWDLDRRTLVQVRIFMPPSRPYINEP
jgi:hypothetical protein